MGLSMGVLVLASKRKVEDCYFGRVKGGSSQKAKITVRINVRGEIEGQRPGLLD